MTGSARPRPPRRRLDAHVELFDGQRGHPAIVRNLSIGGAFAAVRPPLPVGTGVSFVVELPDLGAPIGLRGHVRWTRSLPGPAGEPVGVGIELYEPPADAVARIAAWLTAG